MARRKQDAEQDRAIPIAEAAHRLGITAEVVRKRIHRGTLAGEKRDGRWFVVLDEQDAPSGPEQDGGQDTSRTEPDSVSLFETGAGALIAQLQGENAFLRDQLAERSRELAQERERFDVLHREALARIPQLPSGEGATSPPTTRQEAPGAQTGADVTQRREWWKFWRR